MKRKRVHPSDIVIPAVVAGLIALLLTQWKRVPRRAGPEGLFEDVRLWPRAEEEDLRRVNEITEWQEWLHHALRLADVYGMTGRHGEEAELLEKCLMIRDRHYAPDGRTTLDLVNTLAELYRGRDHAAKALPLQLRLLREANKNNRNLDSFHRELLVETAASQRALGLHADAAGLLRRALDAKAPGEAIVETRRAAEWQQWLQEYREVLALTGKPREEIERMIHEGFGL